MKQYITFINRICSNKYLIHIGQTLILWFMMLAIFVYLLEADLSSAPEFIYNQF